ncbi:MAG: right-handed parallel beta-helix repeat-containing protein [candidate division KSB1 bacterium]|nr:right-handed parallel beta-helix repeat-containing protein [candidate division KSB1 bacterium]
MKNNTSLRIVTLLFFVLASHAISQQSITLKDIFGGSIYTAAKGGNHLVFSQDRSLKIAVLQNDIPKIVSSVLLPFEPSKLFAESGKVYASEKNKFAVIDISNPMEPRLISTADIAPSSSDKITSIYANAQYVFVTIFNDSLKTGSFKVLNKNNLAVLGSHSIVSQDIKVIGNVAYVITGHSSIWNLPQSLRSYSIENLSNIKELSSVNLGGCTRFAVDGNYAYVVGTGRSGITVVDISNPSNLKVTATGNPAHPPMQFINVIGNYAYGAGNTTIYTFNIANKTNIQKTAEQYVNPFEISCQTIYDVSPAKILSFINEGGNLDIFDVSNPATITPLESPFYPCTILSADFYQDKLLLGDGLNIFVLSVENWYDYHILPIENLKFKLNGNYLYTIYNQGARGLFKIYNISNITNPAEVGSYSSTSKVSDLAVVGDYALILNENSDVIQILNCSNPSSPANATEYKLANKASYLYGRSTNGRKLLFAANDMAGTASPIVEILDVTNPLLPSRLQSLNTFDKPTCLSMSANKLYVGGNTATADQFFIQVFDLSNLQTLSLITQLVDSHSYGNILGIFAYEDKVFASFSRGVKTFELTNKVGNFRSLTSTQAPSLTETGEKELTGGRTIAGPESTDVEYGFSDIFVSGDSPYYKYPAYYMSNRGLLQKVEVPNFFKKAEKVNLTMNILPPAAKDNGCNVIPAVGTHEYKKGSEINVYAIDNPQEGWVFLEWTGDISGTNKITHVVMDKDKIANANFGLVSLTVSGKREREVICPDSLDVNNKFNILEINLTASETDGWFVDSITLESSGNTKENLDIKNVDAKVGSTTRFTGKYQAGSRELTMTFSPPLNIPPSQTVKVVLEYEFDTKYIKSVIDTLSSPKSFIVKTKGVAAAPWHYLQGKIIGQAAREEFYIARVFNSQKDAFININDAIKSRSTKEGDTCYVCKGEYNERVSIYKGIALISLKGANLTKIKSNSRNDSHSLYISENNVQVTGFTIEHDDTPIDIQYRTYEPIKNLIICNNNIKGKRFRFDVLLTNSKIINNVFTGIDLLNFRALDECNFDGNELNNGIMIKGEILVMYSRNSIFYKNKLDKLTIHLSKNSRISENKIITAYIGDTYHDEISFNKFYGDLLVPHTALNKTNDDLLENDAFKSSSGENLLHGGIWCPNGSLLKINNNTFNNFIRVGIWLKDIDKANIFQNRLLNSRDFGIYVSECDNIKITDNYIRDNLPEPASVGIYIKDSAGNSKVHLNNIIRSCTGIRILNSDGVSLFANNIVEAFCLFTGISLNSSSPTIINNSIINNQGHGIFTENGSNPLITGNNIFGNNLSGFTNGDASVTVNVSGNYWGSPSGPSPSDIGGNYTNTFWLTEPIALVSEVDNDTVFATNNKQDSVNVYYRNFLNENDIINITLADDKGWLFGPKAFSAALLDTFGAVIPVKFKVPESASPGMYDKIKVKAVSQQNPNWTTADSFYVYCYQPIINNIVLSPDSTTIMLGDTLNCTVFASDQYNNVVPFTPTYRASSGTISSTGLFIPNALGEVTITATDSASGNSGSITVLVVDTTPVLAKMSITPKQTTLSTGELALFQAAGKNQFGFPYTPRIKWTATGGTIDDFGIFLAGNVPGTFQVVAEDTLTHLKDTAIVTIVSTTLIEEKSVPNNYALYQNYPNPFNSITIIRYELPKSSRISLELFDILGRKMETLVNKVQAAGVYELSFNAEKLPSGIYFCRLRADAYVKTVKMILIK